MALEFDLVTRVKKIENKLKNNCEKCFGAGKIKTKNKDKEGKWVSRTCKTCDGEGVIGCKLSTLEEDVRSLKKHIKRVADTLNAYMNRSFTEIRVLPEGNNPSLHGEDGWEEYSGNFYLEDSDNRDIVIDKAEKHFERYFEDSTYHRGKRLGLFLSSPRSGKQLIKEMPTEE